ncbi:5-hydroxytryptamine receptor 2B-like [Rhopilema esculentum]|uniref:5-hydroxytryptamine receptor 2B-like n=1 Tax=Rhopilema esculentum TaxID=499914 RepID=UPI0031E262A0|eukprot:gene6125-11515_t
MQGFSGNRSLMKDTAGFHDLDTKHSLAVMLNQSANFSNEMGNNTFNSSRLSSNTTSDFLPFPDSGIHPLYVALYVFATLLILPGIIGNSLIIAAVSKLRTLRSATNYLICSLAAADLIMMFVMISFLVYDGFKLNLPENIQFWLFPSMDIAVASASIMSLAAVSFDRGLAVLKPLHYDQMFHRKRAIHLIKGIWGYVTFIFILSVLRCKFSSDAYQYTVLSIAYIIGFIMPCGIVTISYAIILFTTLRIIKISRQLERSLKVSRGREDNDKQHGTKKLQLHEAKVAVNLMLILVPFMAGWGFYFGTFWSEHFNGDVISRSALYEWFLLVIPWFISSINPIVYIIFTKMLRQGCKKLIYKYINKRKQGSSLRKKTSNTRSILFRRRSSIDSQSKSLLSLWSRGKRSSSAASETVMTRLHRSSFAVNKEGGRLSAKDIE